MSQKTHIDIVPLLGVDPGEASFVIHEEEIPAGVCPVCGQPAHAKDEQCLEVSE